MGGGTRDLMIGGFQNRCESARFHLLAANKAHKESKPKEESSELDKASIELEEAAKQRTFQQAANEVRRLILGIDDPEFYAYSYNQIINAYGKTLDKQRQLQDSK